MLSVMVNTRIGTFVIIVVIATVSLTGSANGQTGDQLPSPADSNMGCVERLEIPRYPLLATQARIEGTITASVLISPEGLPKQFGMEAESKSAQAKSLLSPPIGKVISNGKFRFDCAGKTVRLVFHFRLQGISEGNPQQTVSFGYPNVFWIVSDAPHFQPEQQEGLAKPVRPVLISGRVVDRSGAAIPGALLRLRLTDQLDSLSTTTTDKMGTVAFQSIQPNTYE